MNLRHFVLALAALGLEIVGFVLVAEAGLLVASGVLLMFGGAAVNKRLMRERRAPRVRVTIDGNTRWEDTIRALRDRLNEHEAVTVELKRRDL